MIPINTYRINNTDGVLYNWNDINNEDFRWGSILIGNGASINVWEKFNYISIYTQASSSGSGNPLHAKDVNLFNALNTHNFEQILSSLKTASIINQALRLPDAEITQRYESIKNSLIGTVSEVHIPWRITPDQTILTIRSEILTYKKVYTTNYDLLIYWSVMHQQNPSPFIDYFFSEEFDSSDTNIYDETKTKVLYLHGALHLYRIPNGTTLKRKAEERRNLLDLFGQPYPGHPDAVPLIVSEGTPEDKLASINQSDYLTFVYNKFSEDRDDLVVFGHSLSNSDMHIVNALAKMRDRRIAIALLPDSATNIKAAQANLVSKLPRESLHFFDATTHPLGSSTQKVVP